MSSKKSHQENQKRLQKLFTLPAENTIADREKRLMYFKEEFYVKRHSNRYDQNDNQNDYQNQKTASTITTVLTLFIFAIVLNVGTCFFAGELAQYLRDYARYSVKERLINANQSP